MTLTLEMLRPVLPYKSAYWLLHAAITLSCYGAMLCIVLGHGSAAMPASCHACCKCSALDFMSLYQQSAAHLKAAMSGSLAPLGHTAWSGLRRQWLLLACSQRFLRPFQYTLLLAAPPCLLANTQRPQSNTCNMSQDHWQILFDVFLLPRHLLRISSFLLQLLH